MPAAAIGVAHTFQVVTHTKGMARVGEGHRCPHHLLCHIYSYPELEHNSYLEGRYGYQVVDGLLNGLLHCLLSVSCSSVSIVL